jgi:hypothetical protein
MVKKPSLATANLSWVLTAIFIIKCGSFVVHKKVTHIGQRLFLSLCLKDLTHGLGNFELAQESMVKIFRHDKNYLKL